MNIFYLDSDYKKIPLYMIDKHIVKMIVETSQLLCSCHYLSNSKLNIPYKLTHKNHPCVLWVYKSLSNYIWLCKLGLEICKEYTYRYDKIHKSQTVIEWCIDNLQKN